MNQEFAENQNACDHVSVDENSINSSPKSLLSAPITAAYTTALLTACGGGSDEENTNSSTTDSSSTELEPYFRTTGYSYTPANDQEAARFLQQAQFSSTKAEIAELRNITLVKWLRNQFNTAWDPANSIINRMETQVFSTKYAAPEYNEWVQGVCYEEETFLSAYWYRLFDKRFKDQMRQRMALALSEFFVIRINTGSVYGEPFAAGYYMDLLNEHAFGTFDKLLEKVTLSFPMGFFLNTLNNKKKEGLRLPDENYAREIMQLFTIGLYKLNLNGTVQLDAAGKPIPTYKLEDVKELAKIFTGYSRNPAEEQQQAKPYPIITFAKKNMISNSSDHDTSPVTFLGSAIPDGSNMAARLKSALKILFNHPNVGPFFARQMIQRLVTSNPTPEYVARVASAFNNNGYGTRGDLKAVWAAILLDQEARTMPIAAEMISGKMREPMIMFMQWARSFGLKSVGGNWKIYAGNNPFVTILEQRPLKAPSVFNFFRPNYCPPGTAIASAVDPGGVLDPVNPIQKTTLAAPEFKILGGGDFVKFINFMSHAIYKGLWSFSPADAIPGGSGSLDDGNDLFAEYIEEMKLVLNATSLMNHLNLVMSGGQISSGNITAMANKLNKTPITTSSSTFDKKKRIGDAILMILCSPEYCIQK